MTPFSPVESVNHFHGPTPREEWIGTDIPNHYEKHIQHVMLIRSYKEIGGVTKWSHKIQKPSLL